jgi:hypothetical protein
MSCATALSYDLRVAKWNSVQPHHVRQAAAEYDQLGQDEFLARHGFGHARAYLLILDDLGFEIINTRDRGPSRLS